MTKSLRHDYSGDVVGSLLPTKLQRIYRLLSIAAVVIGVSLALIRLGIIIYNMSPEFARIDFRFFYVAARSFVEGVSVYSDEYVGLGAEIYDGTFRALFFYPPTLLPVISPLALFDWAPASGVFMATDACITVASLFGACWLLRTRRMVIDWRMATGIAVLLGSAILTPSVSVLWLGQVKFVMLAGLVLWIAGIERRSLILQAVGLTLLMMMPQVGIVLSLVALATPSWRLGLISAGILSLLIYAATAWPHGLFAYGIDFVTALSTYAEQPENDTSRLVGLAFLLGQLGVPLGPFVTVALCIMAAGAIFLFFDGERDPYAAAMLATAVGIFIAPGHSTNALLLMPGLALAMTAGSVLPRALLLGSLLVIGGIEHIISPLDWTVREGVTYQWIYTSALGVLCAALAMMSLRAEPILVRRRSA
ncbi:MAG: glycosyltransferase family 87 protein [Pseudomonadota bacterium]